VREAVISYDDESCKRARANKSIVYFDEREKDTIAFATHFIYTTAGR
jgi:hypothetical protein